MHFPQSGEVDDLLAHLQFRIQASLFGQIADVRAQRVVDLFPVPRNPPFAGLQDPEDHPEGRRFPGPVRPEEPEHFLFRDGQVQIPDGRKIAESFCHIFQLQNHFFEPPSLSFTFFFRQSYKEKGISEKKKY